MRKLLCMIVMAMMVGGCAVDQAFMDRLSQSNRAASRPSEKKATLLFDIEVEGSSQPESLQFFVLDPFVKYQALNMSFGSYRHGQRNVYHIFMPVGRIRLASMTLKGGKVLPIEKIFELFDYGTYDMGIIRVRGDQSIEMNTSQVRVMTKEGTGERVDVEKVLYY